MGIDDELLYKKLGAELKRLRKAVPYSQGELAAKIGIERTSITNIECGRQKAPLHVLYELCQELGVDLKDILPRNAAVQRQEQPEQALVVIEEGLQTPMQIPPKAAEFLNEIRKK